MKTDSASHFVDDGRHLVDFLRRYTVVCPSCGAAANVAITGRAAPVLFAPRRLTCLNCGHIREWSESSLKYPPPNQAIDWYFGLPYYFRVPCAGQTLWVANPEHLEFLRAYVSAKHRTRKRNDHGWNNQSLASRIPRWLASAKNRASVLKALNALEAKMRLVSTQATAGRAR